MTVAMIDAGESLTPAETAQVVEKVRENEANDWGALRERLRSAIADIRLYAQPYKADPRVLANLRALERQLASLERKMGVAA